MSVNDTQIFQAQGLDINGNPVTINDPHWETNTNFGNFVVNPNDPTQCTFTATNAGNGYIMCYEGPPGIAMINGSTDLTIQQPQLTTIEVTPSNITMNVGDTHTFVAQGFDQNGNQMTINPEWTT
ncbi:MAG: hypothetical protein U9Q69_04180, partial [Nanoarchaeota archaeon]|nr:hypothetical protein [Nanoarchaeota archaeon]